MLNQSILFQVRHDLLQFTTGRQELLFKCLLAGKRGLFMSAAKMDDYEARLMFMLWIYCHGVCRTEKQPREIYYISKTRAEANAARNLFHGIGHLCIQNPEDVPSPDECKKQEKKATEKTLFGDLVIRFMWADMSSLFRKLTANKAKTGVIVFCDLCSPHWAMAFSKNAGRYVYGIA